VLTRTEQLLDISFSFLTPKQKTSFTAEAQRTQDKGSKLKAQG